MKEEDFSKEYNEKGFIARQKRIKADKEIVRQRKSIVEHPFGTVKRKPVQENTKTTTHTKRECENRPV